MNAESTSRELIRNLRGERTQPWLSRRIGLRSNLVYRWEAGRAWPTAGQLFRIARAVGVKVEGALRRLLGCPAEAAPLELESRSGVAQLLRTLAGRRSVTELARLLGKSRYVVSRWLGGHTEIRLPDLLRFVEATTHRGLEFLAVFVEPSRLASVAKAWGRLEASRRVAYDEPWSHAVLRAIEVAEFVAGQAPDAAWIAQLLGIPRDEVQRSLTLLARCGQVRKVRGRFHSVGQELIETGGDPERRRALRLFWAQVAVERVTATDEGIHAYNLFTIAEQDLPRLQALHQDFFDGLRALVNESAPAQRILLYSAQLVPLDRGPR